MSRRVIAYLSLLSWSAASANAQSAPPPARGKAAPDTVSSTSNSCKRSYPERISEVLAQEELRTLYAERQLINTRRETAETYFAEIERYVATMSAAKPPPQFAEKLQTTVQSFTTASQTLGRGAHLSKPTCDALAAEARSLIDAFYPLGTLRTGVAVDTAKVSGAVQEAQGDPEQLVALWAVSDRAQCTTSDIDAALASLKKLNADANASHRTVTGDVANRWKPVAEKVKAYIGELNAAEGEIRDCVTSLNKAITTSQKTTASVLENVVLPLIFVLALLYGLTRVFPIEVQQTLIKTRALVEVVGIAFLLITVIALGGADKLQAESLGTLLGSIATYIFGRQIWAAQVADKQSPTPKPDGTAPDSRGALGEVPASDSPATQSGSAPTADAPSSVIVLAASMLCLAGVGLLYSAWTVRRAADAGSSAFDWESGLLAASALACVTMGGYLVGLGRSSRTRPRQPLADHNEE